MKTTPVTVTLRADGSLHCLQVNGEFILFAHSAHTGTTSAKRAFPPLVVQAEGDSRQYVTIQFATDDITFKVAED